MRRFGRPPMSRLTVLASLLLLLLAGTMPSCHPAGGVADVVYFVCPFSAGGSTDIEVRGITPYFQLHYPAKVINDNRVGGGSHVAINYVYQQPADGRYVLVSSATSSIKKLLNPEAAAYSETFLQAFVPVGSWVSAGGNVLATPRGSSIKTFDDFISAARDRTLSVGMPPPGSSDHMDVLMLQQAIGAKFNLVPYEGGSDLAVAVMGGHLDAGVIGFGSISDTAAFNLLGITSSDPVPGFPAPTFTQLGFPQLTSDFVIGAYVKTGTPQAIVDRLDEAFRKAHAEPEYQAWLAGRGIAPSAYKDQGAWAAYLEDWGGRIEAILPALIASMEELGA